MFQRLFETAAGFAVGTVLLTLTLVASAPPLVAWTVSPSDGVGLGADSGADRFSSSSASLGSSTRLLGGGACCLIDGCQDTVDAAACSGLGGFFFAGQSCAEEPCESGACCDFKSGSCNESDAFSCLSSGRQFGGAGTTCLDDPCGIGVGACCKSGLCLDESVEACRANGGRWLGAGTDCSTSPCDDGACCADDSCSELVRFDCLDIGGDFLAAQSCVDDPCAGPDPCPADSLFSQGPDSPEDFIAGSSEADAGFRRWENFSGVAGTIDALSWWGLDLEFVSPPGVFVECVETENTFDIVVASDAGGVPGLPICRETVVAQRTPLGIDYLGAELNEYRTVLPEACVAVDGWVSILGRGDPDCWFLWMSHDLASPDGGESYCEGCRPELQDFDLSICLQGEEGGLFGACCDDVAGSCADAVEITDCATSDLRFSIDESCSELSPPCGVVPGACCFEDNRQCAVRTDDSCQQLGGDWLGADTLCRSCPCRTPCPPGGVAEGEPICSDGYVDRFNGGCFADSPAFTPLELDQPVCGTSGVFTLDQETVGDFDWYAVEVEENGALSWSVDAEFPPRMWIFEAGDGCPGTLRALVSSGECDGRTVTVDVSPGTYWLAVSPAGFTDTSGCGARYRAQATFDPAS